MDFRLTESQNLLVNTARQVFQQHCPAGLVQELALDARGFPDDLWHRISSLGWPGLLVPEALGGSGGSLFDVVLLLEEMGRACFPSPYIQSAVVATSLLLRLGHAQQQTRLLPAMARGERLCTLALVEGSAEFVPEAIAMQGEIGSRLNGSKLFVKDAHMADDLIVVVRGHGGFNLFCVEKQAPDVTVWPMETISGEKLFEVAFHGLTVRPDDLLGPHDLTWDAITPILQTGALARCADMVGCAQRILELCVDYAKVREQSGRPIGSFQAIQHHCANMLRNIEATRYLLYNAVWKMQMDDDYSTDVAMAKMFANDACLWVARQGHQVLGAIGYCEEHPLHLLHKRIQAASLDFGDAALHAEAVAEAIGLDSER